MLSTGSIYNQNYPVLLAALFVKDTLTNGEKIEQKFRLLLLVRSCAVILHLIKATVLRALSSYGGQSANSGKLPK